MLPLASLGPSSRCFLAGAVPPWWPCHEVEDRHCYSLPTWHRASPVDRDHPRDRGAARPTWADDGLHPSSSYPCDASTIVADCGPIQRAKWLKWAGAGAGATAFSQPVRRLLKSETKKSQLRFPYSMRYLASFSRNLPSGLPEEHALQSMPDSGCAGQKQAGVVGGGGSARQGGASGSSCCAGGGLQVALGHGCAARSRHGAALQLRHCRFAPLLLSVSMEMSPVWRTPHLCSDCSLNEMTTAGSIFTAEDFSRSKCSTQAVLGRYGQAGRGGWRRRSPVQLSAVLESLVQNFLIHLLQGENRNVNR